MRMGQQAVFFCFILCGVIIEAFGAQVRVLSENDVISLEPRNVFKSGKCECDGLACKCCTVIKVVSSDSEVCIRVLIEPDDFAVTLGMDFNGKTLVEETVSPQNLKSICKKLPSLGSLNLFKLCLETNKLDVNVKQKEFEICLGICLESVVKILSVDLSCIKFTGGKVVLESSSASQTGGILNVNVNGGKPEISVNNPLPELENHVNNIASGIKDVVGSWLG